MAVTITTALPIQQITIDVIGSQTVGKAFEVSGTFILDDATGLQVIDDQVGSPDMVPVVITSHPAIWSFEHPALEKAGTASVTVGVAGTRYVVTSNEFSVAA